ncbi:hypothetical protein TrRE_jg4487 [Triparma retinervis]|uniref:Uncharacterized protein n=1 Tax=Triparma retinervis TaxID=2557542 RepID=A0A9W7L253_9STRA|nr:hypothetical protein TrRE_jg4487 [Triparma retinervis]
MDDGGSGGEEEPTHPLFMSSLEAGWEENKDVQALAGIIDEADAEESAKRADEGGPDEEEEGEEEEGAEKVNPDDDSSDSDTPAPRLPPPRPAPASSLKGGGKARKQKRRHNQRQQPYGRSQPAQPTKRSSIGLAQIAMGFTNINNDEKKE